jgi:hypothetical protein
LPNSNYHRRLPESQVSTEATITLYKEYSYKDIYTATVCLSSDWCRSLLVSTMAKNDCFKNIRCNSSLPLHTLLCLHIFECAHRLYRCSHRNALLFLNKCNCFLWKISLFFLDWNCYYTESARLNNYLESKNINLKGSKIILFNCNILLCCNQLWLMSKSLVIYDKYVLLALKYRILWKIN